MPRGFSGNLIFAIIARMLYGNHHKSENYIWIISQSTNTPLSRIYTLSFAFCRSCCSSIIILSNYKFKEEQEKYICMIYFVKWVNSAVRTYSLTEVHSFQNPSVAEKLVSCISQFFHLQLIVFYFLASKQKKFFSRRKSISCRSIVIAILQCLCR